jgi:hypothetical protein
MNGIRFFLCRRLGIGAVLAHRHARTACDRHGRNQDEHAGQNHPFDSSDRLMAREKLGQHRRCPEGEDREEADHPGYGMNAGFHV